MPGTGLAAGCRDELDARSAAFAAMLQDSPATVHHRLISKLHLHEDEEYLRL